MRSIGVLSAFLLATISVFGQQYNINTVAGGSPLPTPVAAVNAPIGNPSALASDGAGDIYLISDDCVFKIDLNGNLTRVAGNSRVGYSGDGGSATQAQLNNPAGLAVDSSNNLYIADSGNNRIRKVVLGTGIITTIAGLATSGYSVTPQPAAGAALNNPQGLATDAAGNLYIADTGNNVIRMITAATGVITTIVGNGTAGITGDGQPASTGELNAPTGVALDASNNIYIADSKNNRIREVTSGILSTIAGLGVAGFNGDGNLATAAELNLPTEVTVAPSGLIYLIDSGNNRVREILPNKVIATAAGGGGPVTNPTGITSDPGGNLYVADITHIILKFTQAGSISSFAGFGAVSYYLGDGGPATSAQLVQPEGLAVDTAGNIYVADRGEARIRKFLSGGSISSPNDGNVVGPAGVAIDSVGNIYVADASGNQVIRISGGVPATIAGTGTAGSAGDNQLATSAQLNQPNGIAVDAGGNVYIADTGNHKIRKIIAANGIITTIAGNNTPGFQGDGSSATGAILNQPSGVAVDGAANVYIADTGNNRIRKITVSTGFITTVAGNGSLASSGDGGQATAAAIASPHGVAVDALSNVYIPDTAGRVRKVSVSGLITTIAGNGVHGYSGDGGPATNAQLNTPWGVTVDNGGNVYVSDLGNQAVRILSPVAAPALSVLTTNPLPAGTVGVPYAQTLSAMGGTPPYSWSITFGSLPNGLTLSQSGSITGTPSSSGSFLITFLVTDSASVTAQATLGIVVNASTPTGLAITTPPVLVSGAVGFPYSQSLAATAGNPPYTFTLVSGALPTGIGLSPSGLMSGTPVAAGTSTFTIRVNDNTNAVATQNFTLQVIAVGTLSRTGVLAHFAAGGTWTTKAYLTNISLTPIAVSLVVHTDDGSNLPLNVTQQSSTQLFSANSYSGVMNPNTTLLIDTGETLPNTAVGWIDILTSAGATNALAGFAVFRNTPPNQPAQEGTTSLQLQSQLESKLDLQYDDTAGFVTAFAVANLSTSAATVTATVFDQNGNQLGSYSLSLAGSAHSSFVFPSQFGVTTNTQGVVQFVSNAGSIGAVGLRASTTTGTFTSVPVIFP